MKLKYFQIMYYNLGPSMDKPSTGFLKMGWAMLPSLLTTCKIRQRQQLLSAKTRLLLKHMQWLLRKAGKPLTKTGWNEKQ